MVGVLARNIALPRTDAAHNLNERVVAGLERMMPGNAKLKELLARVKHVSDQYRQFGIPQREQTYAQLKAQMESRLEMMSRQSGQPAPAQLPNVELMPEFQEQWRNISGQLDAQYEQHLEQFRQDLVELAQ